MKNNKKVLLIIGIIVVTLLLLLGGFIIYNKIIEEKENNKIISEIKNSYSKNVITTKNKNIYIKKNNEYKKIGTINKNTVIPLVEKKVLNKDDIYYQIKDTEYYIDYNDIKKKQDYKLDTSLDKYFVTQTIKTTKTNLYQDNELKIELDKSLEFDVLSTVNKNYYIKYLNNIYYIKDNYELINKKLDVNILKDISVLNFSDDISDIKLEEVLKYLKENNYESINIDDFKLWINGNVNLIDKKVLLLSYKELSKEKKQIVEKYNLNICDNFKEVSFTSGDTKLKIGDTKYYKYEINSNTSLNRVKDMLNGIKEVKPQKIAVLNYHFFYDSKIGEACNESICLDISNFRKQLDYLKNNGYKTLTMKEFNDWMDKKITLPSKSVLITIDDGAMGTSFINGNKLIPILEEYQMHATLFLITGWWDVNNYKSNYLEIQSHGNELHHGNYCNNGKCGAKGTVITKQELIEDLNTSINKIGTNLAFCYPFYAKNNTMISALKETGFKLAFVGGNKKASQSDNKYSVPRYIIYKNTSLNSFINMVK